METEETSVLLRVLQELYNAELQVPPEQARGVRLAIELIEMRLRLTEPGAIS